jgi:hypothetical protein
MKQTKLLFALLFAACQVHAQCRTAPVLPACSGTETLTASSDIINVSQTRYFYGSTTTLSNVKLNGGLLIVCGSLTINDLVFDSGAIYVQPTGSLVVSNGGGLVLRGNSAIYNRGDFQCLGNIVLDGTYASASKPNIIINAASNARWKMANQYFVINNPYSWFVNNGIADFHGIITDYNSAAGSVCLGLNSQTRMTVLYNKVKNTYVSPNGAACVSVSQYSQFYDTLTSYPSVNVCLGSMHSSDASCTPWGCRPNAWGAAQVTAGCASCSSILTFLPLSFSRVEARPFNDHNEVDFEMNNDATGMMFYLHRSNEGARFEVIDSVTGDRNKNYTFQDHDLHDGLTRYFISSRITTGDEQASNTVELIRNGKLIAPYPNPFTRTVNSVLPTASKPAVVVTDVSGRRLSNYILLMKENNLQLSFEQLAPGIYFVRVVQDGRECVYRVWRQ